MRPQVAAALGLFAELIATSACQSRRTNQNEVPLVPHIEFRQTEHDFGTMVAGTVEDYAFSFENSGRAPLVLGQPSTSCGCAVVTLKERQVAPGGSGRIEVKYTATGLAGPNHKGITVRTNDPKTPEVRLVLHSNLVPYLDYEPHYLKLVTDDPKNQSQTLWFVGNSTAGLTPRIVEIQGKDSSKRIAAKVVERTENAVTQLGIELRLRSTTKSEGSAVLVVATGLPDVPEMGIPFTWGESVKLR